MVVVNIHDKNRPGLNVQGKLGHTSGLPFWCGYMWLGPILPYAGYYQSRHRKRGHLTSLMRHYWQKPYTTPAALATKQKFREGVTAWHGLTLLQKKVYNDKRYPVGRTGFAHFMSEYLTTH